MKGCIYNTDAEWVNFFRRSPIRDRVNFWRKDRRVLKLESGAPFYFKQLGTQTVIGRGRFAEIETMTAGEAWSRFEQANGYPDRAKFFAALPSVLKIANVDQNTMVNCIVLNRLEWLPKPIPLPADFFKHGTMGAKYVELEKLEFLASAFPDDADEQLLPVVLVENETTYGGAYDHWADRTGETYHFPNQYRNRMIEGRRFIYYRGVRREGKQRGTAEYFGCGRVGNSWRDETVPVDTKKRLWRWYSGIEDYVPFPAPVGASKGGGRYFETVSNPRDWGIDVRVISESVYREILALSGLSSDPLVPPSAASTRVGLTLADGLLKLRITPTAKAGRTTMTSPRRSKQAAAIGRAAEQLVFDHLKKQPDNHNVRWLSRDGELPGYDLSFDTGGPLNAVEVKGTVGAQFPSIELTVNEWQAAEKFRDRFWLYLVASCTGPSPKLQVIQDPYGMFMNGGASVFPVVVRFELRAGVPAGV
jgi:hypothetical protein